MTDIIDNIKDGIAGRKAAMLFTGSAGSTILINNVYALNIDIIFIDTGYHFDEINDYVRTFGDRITVIGNLDVAAQPGTGMAECCTKRKADVLAGYLSGSGIECLLAPFIHSEQNNRIEQSYLSKISDISIIKPLADWSEKRVWMNIKEGKMKYSAIYRKGFSIVDCRCCVSRFGRRNQDDTESVTELDRETEEKLKALGYM
jgi:3'-phosphoadenosine 5'-phosphosulfate sulfotransferase (PAPS reductase)/FAD synthetase